MARMYGNPPKTTHKSGIGKARMETSPKAATSKLHAGAVTGPTSSAISYKGKRGDPRR